MPDTYLGGFLQGGINAGLGVINNWLASNREQNARYDNFFLNEKAADKADARTRSLYNDLQSPKALLQQYKEAGLSPSLMFGGGGIGGQLAQGAQGQGAAGIAPNTFGINPMQLRQLVI